MTKRSRTSKRPALGLDLASPTARLLLLIAERVAKRVRLGASHPGDHEENVKTAGNSVSQDSLGTLARRAGGEADGQSGETEVLKRRTLKNRTRDGAD